MINLVLIHFRTCFQVIQAADPIPDEVEAKVACAGHALVSLDGVVVARSLSVGLAFTLAKRVPDTNDITVSCESDKAGLVVVVRVVCFAQGCMSDRREHHGQLAGAVAGQVEIDRDEKTGLALQ